MLLGGWRNEFTEVTRPFWRSLKNKAGILSDIGHLENR